jgi:hypothetical protein
MAAEVFDGRDKQHDEEEYREWTKKHPNGFVLNSHKRPSRDYLGLHRSGCSAIMQPPPQGNHPIGSAEAARLKVCADSIAELHGWADRYFSRKNVQFTHTGCVRCKPLDTPKSEIPGGGGKSHDAQGQTRKIGSHRDNVGHN